MATATKKPAVEVQKRFSLGSVAKPVTFAIDGDDFEAVPANRLPAEALASYFQLINEGKLFDAHKAFFKLVLTEESSAKFFERLADPKNPITVNLLGEIISWLLGEVYMSGEASDESKE